MSTDEYPDYEIRAAAAGVLLAQHLRLCIQAHADDEPYPSPDDIDAIDFSSPESVEYALNVVAAMAGIQPVTHRDRLRILRLFQALAELIAVQGSELEVSLWGLIADEDAGVKSLVRVNETICSVFE
jgi:hypothetical protein